MRDFSPVFEILSLNSVFSGQASQHAGLGWLFILTTSQLESESILKYIQHDKTSYTDTIEILDITDTIGITLV